MRKDAVVVYTVLNIVGSLGLFLFGMKTMSNGIQKAAGNRLQSILRFMTGNRFMAVLTGFLVTGLVQSSSATTVMLVGFVNAGLLSLKQAIGVIMGASIGTNIHARRSSRAHMLFNVFGVLWMAVLINPFLSLVDLIVPGSVSSNVGITAHLAMFHTMFNLTNTAVCIGFVGQIKRLVKRLVKPREGDEELLYQLKYISTQVQDTPQLNIANAKLELSRMAAIVGEMFDRFLLVFRNPDKKMGNAVESLKKMEDYTDRMQEDISTFLASCAQQNLNPASLRNVNAMIRIAHELETIGDSCFNLVIIAERRYEGKVILPEDALHDLEPYTAVVSNFITFITEHLNRHLSRDELETAFELEHTVNNLRNRLKDEAQERLSMGSDVKSELLYIEIVRQIEQIGDQALNVAQALRQIT